MSTLEEKLALSKQMTRIEREGFNNNIQQPQYTFQNPNIETVPYSAKADMERLKKGIPNDLSHCKLPSAIIESIKQNPLTDISEDPQMDNFTRTLGESMGIKQSANIIEKLEKKDNNNNITETKVVNSNVDYGMIKMIIENVIDEKLQKIQENKMLNENSTTQSNIKTVQFGTDKFLFLDSDDNVYECVMKYKGKRKKH